MARNTPTPHGTPSTSSTTVFQPPKLHPTPNYKDPRYYTKLQNVESSTSITTTPSSGLQNMHHHHSLSSSSEELDEAQPINPNERQQMGRVKRKRLTNAHLAPQPSTPEISNRFDLLMEEATTQETPGPTQTPSIPKPPPIYVHGVINYNDMIRCITEIAKEEQFYTKTMANNIIKL